MKRGLGVPWLFAAAYSAVGFSIYFALGVVAERGLGLTPLIFLAAGLLFGLTTLSYVEGGAMFPTTAIATLAQTARRRGPVRTGRWRTRVRGAPEVWVEPVPLDRLLTR